MTHTAEISRTHPLLFGFLIDQSSSMGGEMAGSAGMLKSQICADYLNAFFNTLLLRNIDGATIKNRFEIFAIGYGGNNQIQSALPNIDVNNMPINLEKLQTISKVSSRERKIMRREPDGTGGIIEKEGLESVDINQWIEPIADGVTPMGLAFRNAYSITQNWISSHSDCFPPIIINITDGDSTDEDPEPIAENLKMLKTDDGDVLVFNISITHLPGKPVLFPDNSYLDSNPDAKSVMLYRMSSNLTENMIKYAASRDIPISQSSKGFAFNADFAKFVDFLDIGTRPATG